MLLLIENLAILIMDFNRSSNTNYSFIYSVYRTNMFYRLVRKNFYKFFLMIGLNYCLAFLKFLLEFYCIVVWLLLGCCLISLGLLFISSCCYSNFLLLFNISNIIIWPNVIQLISKLKVPFWHSFHVWLLFLALFFGFSCDVAYQLNIAPHLFCANLGMKNLDPIHQVIFSIISNMIYKLCFQ